MLRKIISMVIKIFFTIIILGVLVFGLPRLITTIASINKIISIANVPTEKAAIVFGAGLLRDGTPSPVLKDRVSTAAQLYFSGKIQKILMSGDNRFVDYNEPASMQTYALSWESLKKPLFLITPGAVHTILVIGQNTFSGWKAQSWLLRTIIFPVLYSLVMESD